MPDERRTLEPERVHQREHEAAPVGERMIGGRIGAAEARNYYLASIALAAGVPLADAKDAYDALWLTLLEVTQKS